MDASFMLSDRSQTEKGIYCVVEFYTVLENADKCIWSNDHGCLEMGRGWHGRIIQWHEIFKAVKNVTKFYKCICVLKLIKFKL